MNASAAISPGARPRSARSASWRKCVRLASDVTGSYSASVVALSRLVRTCANMPSSAPESCGSAAPTDLGVGVDKSPSDAATTRVIVPSIASAIPDKARSAEAQLSTAQTIATTIARAIESLSCPESGAEATESMKATAPTQKAKAIARDFSVIPSIAFPGSPKILVQRRPRATSPQSSHAGR